MTLYPTDRHITRCPSCGGWQWREQCQVCMPPAEHKESA